MLTTLLLSCYLIGFVDLIFSDPQRIPAIMQAFNDNNVSFVVRGGLQVLVMLADPNAGTALYI